MVTRRTNQDKSEKITAQTPANNPTPPVEPSAVQTASHDPPTSNPQSIHEDDTGRALQPIPGAALIGHGIYLKTRQPYEIKARLFDLGHSQTQTYTSLETGRTYSVPDSCVVNDSPP